MAVTLTTSRLTLRPQNEGDIPAILAGLNDFEVARWLTVVPQPYLLADAREWIARQRPAEPTAANFAIDLPGTGMIGVISIGPGLGYWLDRRHHGHGYMTEAGVALLGWQFAARPDDMVPSGLHIGNEASWNVQKKLGFTDTGRRQMKFVLSQKREVEHMATSLARPAFEAAKLHLAKLHRGRA